MIDRFPNTKDKFFVLIWEYNNKEYIEYFDNEVECNERFNELPKTQRLRYASAKSLKELKEIVKGK